MPLPFQLGLFMTVLVLAGVRFERSLRSALRAGRGAGGGPPGAPTAERSERAGLPERPGPFNWDRWHHLAILWGLGFFCVPFLLAVAFPGRIMATSDATDRLFTGGVASPVVRAATPADWDVPPFTEDEIVEFERSFDKRTSRAREELAYRSAAASRARLQALAGLGASAVVLVALGSAVEAARRLRRHVLMSATAGGAFLASVIAFVSAGPASSRLSAVDQARTAVEQYARARTVRAEDAALLAGPTRIVGRPRAIVAAEPGYLHFRGPVGPGEDHAAAFEEQRPAGELGSPYAGFRLGSVVVPPGGPSGLRVVLPHVRFGATGREHYIREDEDALVIGFVLAGSVAPRPGYPVILAPAGAAFLGGQGVFHALAESLLGTGRPYARYLALLQLLFGAFGAWFLTLFSSGCCELVAATVARRRAGRALSGKRAGARSGGGLAGV